MRPAHAFEGDAPPPFSSMMARRSSQVMIDKAITVMRGKIGESFGRLHADVLLEVERRPAVSLGTAK